MRTGNKTKRPFEVVATLLAAISSVVLLVGATGCGVHSSAAERPSPGLIVVAIDRSDSTDSLRAEQLNQLDLIATEAIADDIPLDVWVFDKSAERVWGPRIPSTRSDLLTVKSEELAPGPSRRMTRPALLLEALADESNVQTSQRAVIILLTDGDQEVWQDQPRLQKASQRLGGLPDARLGVFGIHPENRKAWEAALTPGFNNRYVLAGPSEVDAAIRQTLN